LRHLFMHVLASPSFKADYDDSEEFLEWLRQCSRPSDPRDSGFDSLAARSRAGSVLRLGGRPLARTRQFPAQLSESASHINAKGYPPGIDTDR
jgi:hypothetical protein